MTNEQIRKSHDLSADTKILHNLRRSGRGFAAEYGGRTVYADDGGTFGICGSQVAWNDCFVASAS